jgi:hypothetical protein
MYSGRMPSLAREVSSPSSYQGSSIRLSRYDINSGAVCLLDPSRCSFEAEPCLARSQGCQQQLEVVPAR